MVPSRDVHDMSACMGESAPLVGYVATCTSALACQFSPTQSRFAPMAAIGLGHLRAQPQACCNDRGDRGHSSPGPNRVTRQIPPWSRRKPYIVQCMRRRHLNFIGTAFRPSLVNR
jgi:hypothetical protein